MKRITPVMMVLGVIVTFAVVLLVVKLSKSDPDLGTKTNPVMYVYSTETADGPTTTISGQILTVTESPTPVTVTPPAVTVTKTATPTTLQVRPNQNCFDLATSAGDGFKLKDEAIEYLRSALEESLQPAPDWQAVNDRISKAGGKIEDSTSVVEYMTKLAPKCFAG